MAQEATTSGAAKAGADGAASGKRADGGGDDATAAGTADSTERADGAAAAAAQANLPREEVIRRLRRLGEPATLFGEDDGARSLRLMRAEKEWAHRMVDEARGGQQDNSLLVLQRAERARRAGGAGGAAAAAADKKAGEGAEKKAGEGGEGGDAGGQVSGHVALHMPHCHPSP